MTNSDKKLKQDLLNEVLNSKMSLQKKLKVMQLLDVAFRKYLGIIYLSDEELGEK